jgi:hypothetical protein
VDRRAQPSSRLTLRVWRTEVLAGIAGTRFKLHELDVSASGALGKAAFTHPALTDTVTICISAWRCPTPVLRQAEIRRLLGQSPRKRRQLNCASSSCETSPTISPTARSGQTSPSASPK